MQILMNVSYLIFINIDIQKNFIENSVFPYNVGLLSSLACIQMQFRPILSM